MRHTSLYIDEKVLRMLKIYCIKRNVSMAQVMNGLLRRFFKLPATEKFKKPSRLPLKYHWKKNVGGEKQEEK